MIGTITHDNAHLVRGTTLPRRVWTTDGNGRRYLYTNGVLTGQLIRGERHYEAVMADGTRYAERKTRVGLAQALGRMLNHGS